MSNAIYNGSAAMTLYYYLCRSWQDCCRRGENRSWPSVSVESVDSEYWCLNNAIVYALIMRLTVEERVVRSTFKLNILYLPYLRVKMQRSQFSLTVTPNTIMYMMLLTIRTAFFLRYELFFILQIMQNPVLSWAKVFKDLNSRSIYLNVLLQLCFL